MESFLLYFAKLNIAFGILYLMYRFFLSDDVRLNMRRAYLLAIVPLSVLLPLIEIPELSNSELGSGFQTYIYTLDAIDVTVAAAPEATHSNWSLLFLYLYVGTACVQLFRMLFVVAKIRRRITRTKPVRQGAFEFVPDASVTLPYSFFHYIFVGQQDDEPNRAEIEHEMAHARQWHSADRMIAEITVAFLWINPFIYFWRKAIVELHEFLADRAVVRNQSDWERYSKHLVATAYQNNQLRLTSNFSAQILKKRIKMITRKQKITYWNITVLTLLIAVLVIGFACTKEMHMPKNDTAIVDKTKKYNGEEPFVIVEEMPKYPGGMDSLMYFIARNVKYPKGAIEEKAQGRVFVRFIVTPTGGIDKVSVVRSVHPLLDAEAIRVVSTLPTWEPGRQKGVAVPVWYTVPINFKLNEENKADDTVVVVGYQTKTGEKKDGIYITPAQPASYEGGAEALLSSVFAELKKENIELPKQSELVSVNYVVATDGTLSRVQAQGAVSQELLEAIEDAFQNTKGWIPAQHDGKAVEAWSGCPITLRGRESVGEHLQLKQIPVVGSTAKAQAVPAVRDEGYIIVEEMPKFPGGKPELLKFIAKNVRYPIEARNQKIEGKVYVRYLIGARGEVIRAEIARSVHPTLDQEAIRVVKSMPKWKPGREKGEAVSVWYTMPIAFKLN